MKKRTRKYCPRCGRTRPARSFNSNAARGDGMDSYCRDCINTDARPREPSGRIVKEIRELLLFCQGGHCAWPGCRESKVDLHHKHGHSKLDPQGWIAALCRPHHRLAERRGSVPTAAEWARRAA